MNIRLIRAIRIPKNVVFHVEHHKISSHTVSRETFSTVDELLGKYHSKLEDYLDQLLWWNDRVNLVSRDVSRETMWEHIRHSLLLSQFQAYSDAEYIVDAGTGGGLPGLPLAIISPDKKFLLNDIVSKKIIAVRQMAQKLGLENVVCEDQSVSDLVLDRPFLLVSKHAFKIDELWEMSKEKPWNSMVFYKGIDFEKELEGIGDSLAVDCFDLSEGPEFYQGKALLFVVRG